jgi:glycosyltransferase involved in cell wall biosynthesis
MSFSVLIPAFNAEGSIGHAITSALSQTLENQFEILVYDDGSTDRTFAVVEQCARNHQGIRVIRAAKNAGASRARNVLLEEARGEWIAFLDSDDIFFPTKLAKCLEAATAKDSNYISHDLGYLRPDGQVIGRIKTIGFLQGSVFHRDLIKDLRFSETLSAGEDQQFFCLLKRKARHFHLPDVLTGIKIRSGSLTDKFWFQKRLIELWHETHPDETPPTDFEGYMKFYRSLPRIARFNNVRRWLGQKFGRSAAGAMLAGDRLTGTCFALGSVLLYPSYIASRVQNNRS